jgi:hypothetical protein
MMGRFRLRAIQAQEETMRRKPRLSPIVMRATELAFALVFLAAIVHHVARGDFKPLVAMTVPLLVVFYGFASVLFVRGRALAAGPWQTRSLYAAESAMQATVWYLLGIFLGVTVYALLKNGSLLSGPWLLLFVAPYALMQLALFRFMRAIWTVMPDLLGATSSMAIGRRVRSAR